MHNHVMSYAYPTVAQAAEALPVILAKLRGEDVPLSCLAHCGYVGTGYALSMLLPHPQPMVAGDLPTPDLEGQYAEVLSRSGSTAFASAAVGAFPWAAALAILLKLLEDWLR
jgi:hypothetical protein